MSANINREIAHRLIGRDQAMRTNGKSPPWSAVHGILEFVCREELLSDPVVASWLGTIADGADLWFSHRLLGVVRALIDRQDVEQGHALYRLILGLDNATRWEAVAPKMVSNSILADVAIEPILGSAGLLVRHASSWGRTACDLLGRLVCENQKKDWSWHFRSLAGIADDYEEPVEVDHPFNLKKDDNPTVWYFAHGRPDTPCVRIAAAVELGVREAAQLPHLETFQVFAGLLLEQGYAVGIGMLLAALLDGLTTRLASQPWHAAEAARLLSLDEVQQHESLGIFRRLVRRALPCPDDETTLALTNVIRRSDLAEVARMREFCDIAGWGKLHIEEQRQVAELVANDGFAPPSDPRADPLADFHDRPTPRPALIHKWPNPEDQWAIAELSAKYQDPEKENKVAETVRLERHLKALQALLGREAKDAERWQGEILGWCKECVLLLRRDEIGRLGRNCEEGRLSAAEWEACLLSRAPWWKERAEAALLTLGSSPPYYHRERRTGGLSWGTSDQVMQSFAYLDEVLAIDGAGPFADLRLRMESVIDSAWPSWPSFTRATAICRLRPWYWLNLERLRGRLADIVTDDNDPLVLTYAVNQLLIIGGPDFGSNLGQFLRRASSIESSAEIVNRVGLAMGNAYIRGYGQANPGDGVRQLMELWLSVEQAPIEHRATREALIRGLLFGALDSFRREQCRTQPKADALVALAAWTLSEWPWSHDMMEDHDRFPLLAVTAVLGLSWPSGIRRSMVVGLQKLFLQVMRCGSIADFCSLHFELGLLLRGENRNAKPETVMLECGDFSDEQLIELCRASGDRVTSWRKADKSSNDLAWGSALVGHETADLIRAVMGKGIDRDFLRREMLPIVDELAQNGAPGIATELRLFLRRG